MSVKQFPSLAILVFACGVTFAGSRSESEVAQSNVFAHASFKNIQVTNMTEVGWQILTGMERSIEVRCALLLVLFRYNQKQVDKEYCKEQLDAVGLGERNVRIKLFDLFSRFYDLQLEGEANSEAVKEVSMAISNTQDTLESELLRMCNPKTCPPTKAYFTKENCSDILVFLSPEEKPKFVLLYTFFKRESLRVFAEFMSRNNDANNLYQKENLLWYNNLLNTPQLTEDEVNFMIPLITNQRGGTNSIFNTVSERKTNMVERTQKKENGLSDSFNINRSKVENGRVLR